MIRSLRTGVSGMKTHQVRMDTTGNNIANVNTIGYKRSRAAFTELLGQQLLGVGRTAGGSGINPSYIGLGVGVSSIDQNWEQGSLENTSRATDLALNGDGFFVVRSANDRNLLTRAGNFTFNDQGELVTSNGLNVQGFAYDKTNNQIDRSQMQDIKIDWSTTEEARFTDEMTLGGNLSADAADGEVVTLSAIVYDEQGTAHNAIVEFTKTANEDEWTYEARYGGSVTPPPFATVTGTMTFNVDGTVQTPSSETLTWDAAHVTGAPTISLDLSGITQYSGSTTVTVNMQNGYEAGVLVGFSIDPQGLFQLNFSNGQQETVFQVAIGNVNNPNGLEQLGDNFFGKTGASGDLVIGVAGREVQTSLVSGALEQSNVDLATEFTEMIVAQRGYQASARVITTSDEMLQETVALKR